MVTKKNLTKKLNKAQRAYANSIGSLVFRERVIMRVLRKFKCSVFTYSKDFKDIDVDVTDWKEKEVNAVRKFLDTVFNNSDAGALVHVSLEKLDVEED